MTMPLEFSVNQVGADVEAHLFPVSTLDHPARGGFAQYILRHGNRIFGA